MHFVFSGEDYAEERYYVPKADGDDLQKTLEMILKLCGEIGDKVFENGSDYKEFLRNEDYQDIVTWKAYKVSVLAMALPVPIRETTQQEVP